MAKKYSDVFKCKPTDLQKGVINFIRGNDISILEGEAGTGKDFCSMFYALSELVNKSKEKIIVAKPIVEIGTPLGFLPGTEKEKMCPYEKSVLEEVENIMGAEAARGIINSGKLEFINIGYVRGSTLKNAVVILTEAQNCTLHQLISFVTRISDTSKLILNGDRYQPDIKNSGFETFIELYKEVESIGYMSLGEEYQMRHPLIVLINRIYRNYLNENTNRRK